MMKNKKTRFKATAFLALAVPALCGGVVAPAHAETSTATFQNYTSPASLSSQYHVYADGIDWSKPVGAVFYLDGDYWTNDQSKVYNPQNADLVAMAKVAAEHNMVFVPVISPDKDAKGDGITWWENQDANGNYFRSFVEQFTQNAGIDRSNIWTVGYSGGAEISTFELNADRQSEWRDGGGSVMIGGGGSNGMQTAPSASAKNVAMDWYAGQNDVSGVTYPVTWSALGAAQQGKGIYDSAGFTNTDLKVIPGTDHYGYDFASYLAQSLNEAGVANGGGVAPAPAPTATKPAPVETSAPAPTATKPAPVETSAPAPTATKPAPVETSAPAPTATKPAPVESVVASETAANTTKESTGTTSPSAQPQAVSASHSQTNETVSAEARNVTAQTGFTPTASVWQALVGTVVMLLAGFGALGVALYRRNS